MRVAGVIALACLLAAGCSGGGGSGLEVTSAAFADGRRIPERYACTGQGMSPPLRWTRVPFVVKQGTTSGTFSG